MCTFDSAVAPEFALHHSFVDKIWMDWQRQSNAHLNAHFPGVANNMTGTGNLHPRDVLDNSRLPGGVRVEYQTSRRPQFLGALRHTGGMTCIDLTNYLAISSKTNNNIILRCFKLARAPTIFIRIVHISHNTPCLPPPTLLKFYIIIVFNFSYDDLQCPGEMKNNGYTPLAHLP